jgi:hypothetical protein
MHKCYLCDKEAIWKLKSKNSLCPPRYICSSCRRLNRGIVVAFLIIFILIAVVTIYISIQR